MGKKFVLSGYFGFKNFGDEAILSVLIKKLKEHNAQITVISSDTEYTTGKFDKINSVYTFDIERIFKAIKNSDILISGGGSLLQDVTSLKSLIYYLLIIFIGLILRKKVVIFAQGIGPINNPIGEYLTKSILKHCTYLSVRDAKSLDLLKSWKIDAELLCDPIFSTKIPYLENREQTVAVQLRNFKTMNKDFIDRLAQKVLYEFPNRNIEIYSFQDSIDIEVCKEFEHSIKLLSPDTNTKLFTNLSDEEIIQKISSAEYLIAMRFHAIIVGLLSATKTLAINYDVKVKKIAKEFDIPIIDLQKEFDTQFEQLKNQDLAQLKAIVDRKIFNWTNFEKTINS